MSVRPWRDIYRRKSRQISVGSVKVGGDAPISVQTMTNTLTSDAKATIEQVVACAEAGADIVRVSCPDQESTRALKEICRESPVPIVADIHFHYKRAIESAEAGAACLRINPGNIGKAERVREVIRAARDYGCSMRIGVNAGSLEPHLLEKYAEPCPDAMVESALAHAKILEDNDFHEFKISVKASDVFLTAAAYQQLADACDHPLHLGVTESGSLNAGTVKSAIGLGNLLWMGIGDTMRVSLSADPVEEVRVGFEILKSLNLRHKGVTIISCPSCARQGFDVIKTVEILERRLEHVKTPMSLSIIGCVVNGPGEALMTDVGFTGGGAGSGMVYLAGKQSHKMSNEQMIDHIVEQVEEKAEQIEAEKALKAANDRVIAIIAGGLVLAAVFMVAYVRSVDSDHRRWHVNPLTAERTGKPNEFVVMPPGHGSGDMESPVFDMSPQELEHKLAAIVAQEPRTHRLAGDLGDGFLTYVARSEWIGFPDYITVLVEPVGENKSAVAIWSRARFGYSDWGVNEARVRRWLEALQS